MRLPKQSLMKFTQTRVIDVATDLPVMPSGCNWLKCAGPIAGCAVACASGLGPACIACLGPAIANCADCF